MNKGKGLNTRIRQIFCLLLLAALMTAMSAAPVTAQSAAGNGSISVTLRNPETGEAVSGGAMSLYQVGRPSGSSYVLTADFQQSGLALTNLTSPNLAADLWDYAQNKQLQGQTQTAGETGILTFSGLADGLYLIVQTQACEGYYAVSPFLVTVRYGERVDATPKMEPLQPVPDEPEEPDTPDNPKEPDKPIEPEQPSQPETPENPLFPITGDDASLLIFTVILLFAAGGIVILVKRRK